MLSNGINSAIMPRGNQAIAKDGKVYSVRKLPRNNTLIEAFAPQYKGAVIVDGKVYNVKEVPDLMCCDRTKKVVTIDGKTYNVTTKGKAELKAVGQQVLGRFLDKTV